MKVLISKALIDSNISHDDFFNKRNMMLQKKKSKKDLKCSLKMLVYLECYRIV